MSMLALVAMLAVGAQQDPVTEVGLRGTLALERPATGALHVHAYVRRQQKDGDLARFGKRELFDRMPDAKTVADNEGRFHVATGAGAFALFAFSDIDGDGRWTPAVPEPCGWAWRADRASGGGEPIAITLRAPTHLPRRDVEVDHGALRWIKGFAVVRLRGTAEQRGFAHGRLLAAQIVDFFRCYILEDRMRTVAAYREFERFLETAFAWPEPFVREVDGVLAGMQAAGVDLRVPELGRDFGRTELFAINAYIETRAMRSSCTQFAAWGDRTRGTDVDGGTIAARNMDGEIDLRRVTVSHFVLFAVTPAEPDQKRYVSMMWPGFVGTITGFNEAGLHCMENAGGTGPGPVVDRLQPISWVMREALARFDVDSTPEDFERLLAAHANSGGGACGPGCIVVCALPSTAKVPAWVVEGDRFGHASRLAGEVAPFVSNTVMTSNHHLEYGADPDRPGTYFGRKPSFSSQWRYEAGRHKLEGLARTGRRIGTAEMRELLQAVAHGTTEHSIITRPDALEFDVAVASMKAEPWDAPYRAWTTFAFEELFTASGER